MFRAAYTYEQNTKFRENNKPTFKKWSFGEHLGMFLKCSKMNDWGHSF
jgi:hypothetical protein